MSSFNLRVCISLGSLDMRHFVGPWYHTEGIYSRSTMLRLGRGTLGCKAWVEIPAQRPPHANPKVAQLIVACEFTVIQLSTC